jgi:hypothetical protein
MTAKIDGFMLCIAYLVSKKNVLYVMIFGNYVHFIQKLFNANHTNWVKHMEKMNSQLSLFVAIIENGEYDDLISEVFGVYDSIEKAYFHLACENEERMIRISKGIDHDYRGYENHFQIRCGSLNSSPFTCTEQHDVVKGILKAKETQEFKDYQAYLSTKYPGLSLREKADLERQKSDLEEQKIEKLIREEKVQRALKKAEENERLDEDDIYILREDARLKSDMNLTRWLSSKGY